MLGDSDNSKARRKLDDYFDSLLPKTGGGLWGELIVYLYLLRRNVGYVLPMLLNQRILTGMDKEPLIPPDFLIITYDGSIVGVEVGGGKETQSGRFSAALRGCQMVTVENPRVPPRCPICGKKTLFCPKVIEDFADIENNPLLHVKKDILCIHHCKYYKPEDILEGLCPYTLYWGPVSNRVKPKQKIKFEVSYHYHYQCIRNIKDKVALTTVSEQYRRFRESGRNVTVLKMNYPYVEGLETLEEKVTEDQIVCYGKYPCPVDRRNCEFCKFLEKCKKVTELSKILQDLKGLNRSESLEKLKELF